MASGNKKHDTNITKRRTKNDYNSNFVRIFLVWRSIKGWRKCKMSDKEFIGAILCNYADLLQRKKVRETMTGERGTDAINQEISRIYRILKKMNE